MSDELKPCPNCTGQLNVTGGHTSILAQLSCDHRVIAALRARIAELEEFARDVAENWDCDSDGHKYKTGCRCCRAMKLLKKGNKE